MTQRIGFERELTQLKNKVTEMGECALVSYEKLLAAVRDKNTELMMTLQDSDREMIDMLRSIEAGCLLLMTRQQPVVAGDLRFVTAVLKIVTELERTGDHAGEIAELYLRRRADGTAAEQSPRGAGGEAPDKEKKADEVLLEMLQGATEMLREVMTAFREEKKQLAEEVIAGDDVIDGLFNQVKELLMDAMKKQEPDPDEVVDALMIAKYLEKVGDHAVNIGRWTIFRLTGEIEGREIY